MGAEQDPSDPTPAASASSLAEGEEGTFLRGVAGRLRPVVEWVRRGSASLWIALLPSLVVAAQLVLTPPLSYDHATHLFKAWHFWEEMLGRGRLRGWSHYWAFGFPSDELVPMGGEVWVCLFRALTLGQVPWLQTYALSFAALMVLKTFTAYHFTKPLLGSGAAIACAWLTMLDPGGMLEGGWTWHTYWGVWPVTLCMCFVRLALTRLHGSLSRERWHDVLWTGLWFGAALLTHQMALVVMAIAFPLLSLAHAVATKGGSQGAPSLPDVAVSLLRGACGLAVGGGLSAFFLLPFLARSAHTQDLGWLGDGLPVVSQHFASFQVFQYVWPPVHALALLGGALLLLRREGSRAGIYLSACAGVFVVLASGTLIRDLHLERVMPSLVKVESNRMLLVAKLFWFPLAGYGFSRGLAAVARALRGGSTMARWQVAILLVVGGVLLLPGASRWYDTQIAKPIVGPKQRKHYQDMRALLHWTSNQRRQSDEHYRIAYKMWRGEHISTLAPVYDDTLMYKVGYTPTQIFNKMPMTDEHALLRLLSVKYVVSPADLKDRAMTLVKRFGGLGVYEFQQYDPQPFHVDGSGRAELLEFSPERMRVRVSGAKQDTRVVFHVAAYDRWRVTQESRDLPIKTVPAFGAEYPHLMEVPARDGELELSYTYQLSDWVGLGITVLSLPALFLLSWVARRRSVGVRLARSFERHGRLVAASALAVGLLLTSAVAWGTRTRTRLLPKSSIFQTLENRGELWLGDQLCEWRAPLSYRCGSHLVRAQPVSGAWGVHLCMSAPTNAGVLRLVTTMRLRDFLAAHYDPAKKGRGALELWINGEKVGSAPTRPSYLRHQQLRFDTRPWSDVEAQVELRARGAALHCFDASPTD